MKRRVLLVVAAALASGLAAIAYTEVASADPPQQNGAPVVEQNVDDQGLIRVHEQGTASVQIAGTPTVNVGNFPPSQQVAGTVNVGNLPPVQAVLDTGRPSANHFQRVTASHAGTVLFGPAAADTGLAITALTWANFSDEHSNSAALRITRGPWREGGACTDPTPERIFQARIPAAETLHFEFPDEPLVAENDENDEMWCLILITTDLADGFVNVVGHSFSR